MKSKRIVSLLVVAGLLAAVAALAAEAKKQAEPVKKTEVVRVEVRDGDEAGAFAWEDDDLGVFALGDGDFDVLEAGDDGPGGDDVRRIVIRRGPGHGGGMGMGRGMGRHGGMGMRGGMGMGMGRGFASLDLTDAQREKMADLHERQQRKAVQARADLQLARMDLHKLMRADAPSATAINAQIDKVSKLQTDLRKSQVATLLESRALLTPEQLKQLKERRGPGAGRGFGPGAGPRVQ